MPKFIQAGRFPNRINLDDVVEFTLDNNGDWFAHLRDDNKIKIGTGEYTQRKIEIATSPIVPATAGEVLHRFYLETDNDPQELVHLQERIIAWAIEVRYPTPITATGAVSFGWNAVTKEISAVQQPDGYYDTTERILKDEGAVRKEVERLLKEEKEEKAARTQ